MTKYQVINPKTESVLGVFSSEAEALNYKNKLKLDVFIKHGDGERKSYNKVITDENEIFSKLSRGEITYEEYGKELQRIESSEEYILYNKIMDDILLQGISFCYIRKINLSL